MNLTDVAIGGGFFTVLWGAAIWLGRTAVIKALERGVQRNVEKYKAELSAIQDRLKHDLQKDMLRASSRNDAIHKVYPLLFEKIQIAHGAIAGLVGLSYEPTYQEFDASDFERLLSEEQATNKAKTDILRTITSDRVEGIKELKSYLRMRKVGRVGHYRQDATNFRLSKALYLSEQVRNLAEQHLSAIGHAFSEYTVGERLDEFDHKRYFEDVKDAETALSLLEKAMREELSPRDV